MADSLGTDNNESNASAPSTLNPEPHEYSPTNNFLTKRNTKQKGIFTSPVIEACFDGDVEEVPESEQQLWVGEDHDGYVAMLVGEVAECYFGLVVNPVEKVVIEGHILQVNPVQASMSGVWSKKAIEGMQRLTKEHEGGVWNSYINPYIGNSEKWTPDDKYDDRQHR